MKKQFLYYSCALETFPSSESGKRDRRGSGKDLWRLIRCRNARCWILAVNGYCVSEEIVWKDIREHTVRERTGTRLLHWRRRRECVPRLCHAMPCYGIIWHKWCAINPPDRRRARIYTRYRRSLDRRDANSGWYGGSFALFLQSNFSLKVVSYLKLLRKGCARLIVWSCVPVPVICLPGERYGGNKLACLWQRLQIWASFGLLLNCFRLAFG